ncbi:4-(cytidine 5'-diphospho)-2-C-methyl-D-erythritol kinase [Pirellulaceae bacterium SH449]
MKLQRIDGGFHTTVPCKVNLALRVNGCREDGYHELETIMLAVGLCDELEFRPDSTGEFQLQIDFSDAELLAPDDPAWDVPDDARNLVIKGIEAVARAFETNKLGRKLGGNLRLKKRIPSQAGLGGGSADGAAAIMLGAIASVGESFSWKTHFPVCQQVAASLGSDLNFFLEGRASTDTWVATCRGRGELINPIDATVNGWLVVAHPPAGCSTKEVFARLRLGKNQDHTVSNVLESLKSEQLTSLGNSLFNDLEEAASQVTPYIERVRNWFDRYDHLGQCMSGSGSARFCLCDNREQAEIIANDIRSKGVRAYAVQPWMQPSMASQLTAMWLSEP